MFQHVTILTTTPTFNFINTTINNYKTPNFLINSPLEQFELTDIFGVLNTSSILVLVIITSLTILRSFELDTLMISVVGNIVNTLTSVLSKLALESLNMAKQYYVLQLIFLFQAIFLLNLSGLIPFAFTVTSSFITTFLLAAMYFIFINISGLLNLKYQMFSLFLPSGTPVFIAPFLVIIELISYIARVFSLSIRLFANMMSGHALLKILIGLAFSMISPSVLSISALAP